MGQNREIYNTCIVSSTQYFYLFRLFDSPPLSFLPTATQKS